MRQKASQLVKNAIDTAKKESKADKEKKSPEKKGEKKKNTFKDLYDMVSAMQNLFVTYFPFRK